MRAKELFEETCVKTEHVINLNGNNLQFTAIAEDYVIEDEQGVIGSMFIYTFLKNCEKHDPGRPVMFIWDGGPGAGCSHELMSFYGPWRIKKDALTDQYPLTPPYEFEENPNTILDVCDLVFVDPLGSGFSYIQSFERAQKYFNIMSDAAIFSDFIEKWLTTYSRWNSPRYLSGTSYGTIRCARVLDVMNGGAFLKDSIQRSVPFNGCIMIGNALAANNEYTSLLPEGTDATALFMRSMAAANWYYNKKDSGILQDEFCDEAEKWANENLVPAHSNENLDENSKLCLAEKMSYYTGIAPEMLMALDLRIEVCSIFAQSILSSKGLDAGVYDARMTLKHNDLIGVPDDSGDDPAMGVYTAVYVAAANSLLKEKLNLTFKRNYIDEDYKIAMSWNWDCSKTTIMDEIPSRTHLQCVTAAQRRNEKMQILFATGKYDLCTWAGTTRYFVENCGFDQERTTVLELEGGHMAFNGLQAGIELGAAIRKMIDRTK